MTVNFKLLFNILIMAFILVLSFMASASETAFLSLNKTKLKRDASNNINGAKLALKISNRFNKYFLIILITNDVANQFIAMLGTLLFMNIPYGSYISTFVSAFFLIMIGEVCPKLIALRIPNNLACNLSYFVRFASFVFWPISLLYLLLEKLFKNKKTDELLSEEVLDLAIDAVEDEGFIDENKADLLHSVMDFGDKSCSDIVSPRVDIVAIDLRSKRDEWRKVAIDSGFSRLPVYNSSSDDILGILLLEDYLRVIIKNPKMSEDAERKIIKKLVKKPVWVPFAMKVDDAYKMMMKKHIHMVIVSDEFGGTRGIVTLDDIFECLIGKIWDEDDTVKPDISKTESNDFLLDGTMPVVDFIEEFSIDEKTCEEWESYSVGGLALEILGHFPQKGEVLKIGNVELKIEEVDKRRILSLRATIKNKSFNKEE